MAEIADLRTRSVLPIGTVMLLTDLTARQIRYYETQGLVKPQRNAGNPRHREDSDAEVRKVLRDELLNQSRLNQSPDPGPVIGFRQSH